MANLAIKSGRGVRRDEFRRAAEEGEYDGDAFEFVQAVQEFKRVNGKSFVTTLDHLRVALLLGYRKTAIHVDD